MISSMETCIAKKGELSNSELSDKIILVNPPELAVASVVAEGCCAAAEGGRGFDYRL